MNFSTFNCYYDNVLRDARKQRGLVQISTDGRGNETVVTLAIEGAEQTTTTTVPGGDQSAGAGNAGWRNGLGNGCFRGDANERLRCLSAVGIANRWTE